MRFETGGDSLANQYVDSLQNNDPNNPNGGLDGSKWIFANTAISTPFSDPVDAASYFIGAATDLANALNWSITGSGNPQKDCYGYLIPIVCYQALYGKSQFVQCTMVACDSTGPTMRAGLIVLAVPASPAGVPFGYVFGVVQDRSWILQRSGSSTATLASGSGMVAGDVFRLSADLSVPGQVTITVKRNGSTLTTYTDTSGNRITIGSPGLACVQLATTGGTLHHQWRTFSCGAGS